MDMCSTCHSKKCKCWTGEVPCPHSVVRAPNCKLCYPNGYPEAQHGKDKSSSEVSDVQRLRESEKER